MDRKAVIAFLKEANHAPSSGAAERCIAALPPCKQPVRLLPLVRLQLTSLPIGAYIAALAFVVLEMAFVGTVPPVDAIRITAISGAVVVMLFGWHSLLPRAGAMEELEKCCKYGYGQILLSRVFALCAVALAVLAAAAVPAYGQGEMGLSYLLAAVLPTLVGSLAALLYANSRGQSSWAQMTAYLVAALMVGLLLDRIAAMGVLLLCGLLLAAIAVLFVQTKTLLNRRMQYEADFD